MPTREIQNSNLKAFCEKFLNLHRGELMSLTKIEPTGQRVEIQTDVPLADVAFQSGECNDRILITLEGRRAVQHEVIEPIHVKLRDEAGGKKALQFDAENGSILLLFKSDRAHELIESVGTSG